MSVKRISKTTIDIKPPQEKYKIPAENVYFKTKKPSAKIKKRPRIIYMALGLIFLACLINILQFKNVVSDSLSTINNEITKIRKAVPEFDTQNISLSLNIVNDKIETVQSKATNYGLSALSSAIGKIFPVFAEIFPAMQNASLLTEKTSAIAKNVDYLKNNGLQLITQQKGNELIKKLEEIKNNISEIENAHAQIKNQVSQLKKLSPQLASFSDLLEKNYIPINTDFYLAESFLNSFISILKSPGDQHILLIFQNPSEMRPTGGFIGSYGDFVLDGGSLKELRVDDIYNADRQMPLKIIPPKELQNITKNWGARDANWFFDFPTSAKKIIALLEQAELYSEKSITFHGLIALNTNILGTLLDITGPIDLPDYNLKIDSKNFLQEIQYEVEAGRDKQPGQNPKRILSHLAPALLEKLKSLNDEQKKELIIRFKNHFEQKDIMVYFKDWNLQNFVTTLGVAGDVLNLSTETNSDYLALVNANVGAGKTDAFINQRISLKSEISTEGKIINELSVTRTHNGQNEKDWWYKVTNKDYLKILVPEKSKLIFVDGNDSPPAQKNYNYENYDRDIDLASIEKTMQFDKKSNVWTGQEFNKNSFGTWFNTPAGETKELKINYESSVIELKDGAQFQFVYEKQSGVNDSLEYSVTAPPGYIWKESNNNIFEYKTEKPRAREIISLTLEKIK